MASLGGTRTGEIGILNHFTGGVLTTGGLANDDEDGKHDERSDSQFHL